MCWNKGRLCWKIAKLFYFCHLKKSVRPETFGPYHVHYTLHHAGLSARTTFATTESYATCNAASHRPFQNLKFPQLGKKTYTFHVSRRGNIRSPYPEQMGHSTTVSPNFLLADPFWLQNITTDSHNFAQVNADCPDDFFFLWRLQPNAGYGLHILEVSISHTTHYSR